VNGLNNVMISFFKKFVVNNYLTVKLVITVVAVCTTWFYAKYLCVHRRRLCVFYYS